MKYLDRCHLHKEAAQQPSPLRPLECGKVFEVAGETRRAVLGEMFWKSLFKGIALKVPPAGDTNHSRDPGFQLPVPPTSESSPGEKPCADYQPKSWSAESLIREGGVEFFYVWFDNHQPSFMDPIKPSESLITMKCKASKASFSLGHMEI